MIAPGFQRWVQVTVVALAALGVLLAAGKLLGWVGWPWWLVLLPFAPIVLVAVLLVIGILAWIASGAH